LQYKCPLMTQSRNRDRFRAEKIGYPPGFTRSHCTPEAAGLKELPAGSFYTEPANVAHYVEIREPTVIQVSGTGPSGRKFVGPNAPK
jgi:hypothetical protein